MCDAKLSKDFEIKGRPYLTAAVERNRHGATIRMVPTLVAASLSRLGETQPPRNVLESRAVPLGMYDFGGICGEGRAFVPIFVGDYLEDIGQLM